MKKPHIERFGDFMAGKGFYMVLFLCVAAIGISGYYLFSSLAGPGGNEPVSATAQVMVTPKVSPSLAPAPSVSPVKPSVAPAPTPTQAAKPTPAPSPASTPSAKPTVATATVFTWPVKGTILDAYSPDKQRYDVTMEDWRTHSGIDISAEPGAQVKAAAGGTVGAITVNDLLGTTLTIDHGNGIKSVYSNLAELPTVEEGDTVATGDIIGSVGTTAKGESQVASHLHLEILKNDSPADPLAYLPELH